MRVILQRISAAVAITGAGLLSVATPALADPGWGSVDCAQTPSPDCEIGAGSGSTSGGNTEPGNADSGSSGPVAEGPNDPNLTSCGYRPSGYRPPPGAAGSGALPGDGVWLDGLCSAIGFIQTPEYVIAVSPAEIARLARSQLRLPTPTIAANPGGDQLVNLPTWMWLTSGWESMSATASVPGVSVTAVATPTSVTWSMGDGVTVTCTGAGTPFRPGGDPKSAVAGLRPHLPHVVGRASRGKRSR